MERNLFAIFYFVVFQIIMCKGSGAIVLRPGLYIPEFLQCMGMGWVQTVPTLGTKWAYRPVVLAHIAK